MSVPETKLCAHCVNPIQRTACVDQDGNHFCCSGCEAVYSLLHARGLEKFYALRDRESTLGLSVGEKDDIEFSFMDNATFYRDHVDLSTAESAGACSISLFLQGIHCTGCIWLVEQLPQLLLGVQSSVLDFNQSIVQLRWDDNVVKLSQIARFLHRLGYRPHPARSVNTRELRRKEEVELLARTGVAFACAGNVMLFAVSLYAGSYTGISPEYANYFRWASMFLTIPAMFWSGAEFYTNSWRALKNWRIHLDLPIAFGLVLGFITSAINTWRGAGEVYYDSLTAVVFLLILSRWLQFRGQRIASDKAELSYSLLPSFARRVIADQTQEVPIEAIVSGDLIKVLPHEIVPIDGVISSGQSAIDSSVLTGESAPESVREGQNLFAGQLNLESPLVVKVSQTGEQTRLGRLLKFIEQSGHKKTTVSQFAEKMASRFVVALSVLALVAFALGYYSNSASPIQEALQRVVALFIVACPCAVAFGIPLALAVAQGTAARSGILIKDLSLLEVIPRIRHVAFDKTGTVTTGELAVTAEDSLEPWLSSIIAIEKVSAHPLANAIARELSKRPSTLPQLPQVSQIRESLGFGVVATVQEGASQAYTLAIGNAAHLERSGTQLTSSESELVAKLAYAGYTPVLVAVDGTYRGSIAISDTPRKEVQALVNRLHDLNLKCHLVSGDRAEIVSSVGRRIGIPESRCLHAQSPEEKLEFIARHLGEGIAMLGDGVNDAAALSKATVGVAVCGGVEASLLAADVFFTKPDLMLFLVLLTGANKTMSVIRRNLKISLCYNFLGAALAISGMLGPLGAAILMPLSSLSVVLSSIRNRGFTQS